MKIFLLTKHPKLERRLRTLILGYSPINLHMYVCSSYDELYRAIVRHSPIHTFGVFLDESKEAAEAASHMHIFYPDSPIIQCRVHDESGTSMISTAPNYFLLSIGYSYGYLCILKQVLARIEAKLICIPYKRNYLEYNYNEIIYIESDQHHIRIHTVLQEECLYMKLKTVHPYLFPHYIRCHQSYIVNMEHIKEMSRYYFLLKDDVTRIPISRTHKKNSEEAYLKYVREKDMRPQN